MTTKPSVPAKPVASPSMTQIAKQVTGAKPGTPVKDPDPVRLTRGWVMKNPGDGTLMVLLDGAQGNQENWVPCDVLGPGGDYPVFTIVEVLIAPPRVVVLGPLNDANGGWLSYTPRWGQTTGAITFGNATLRGEYKLVGGLCFVHIVLNFGSTTALGSGQFFFYLPYLCADEYELPTKLWTPAGYALAGFSSTQNLGTVGQAGAIGMAMVWMPVSRTDCGQAAYTGAGMGSGGNVVVNGGYMIVPQASPS